MTLLKPYTSSQQEMEGMDVDDSNLQPEEEQSDSESRINLTQEDKRRIYTPWKYSIIIKIFGKKLNHIYLERRLSLIWRLTEEIILIDLGYDYFIVKLLKEENAQKILQKRPWFVSGFFISVKSWHPNFVASKAKETTSAIWVCLPKLPAEFYDHQILAKVGKKVREASQDWCLYLGYTKG